MPSRLQIKHTMGVEPAYQTALLPASMEMDLGACTPSALCDRHILYSRQRLLHLLPPRAQLRVAVPPPTYNSSVVLPSHCAVAALFGCLSQVPVCQTLCHGASAAASRCCSAALVFPCSQEQLAELKIEGSAAECAGLPDCPHGIRSDAEQAHGPHRVSAEEGVQAEQARYEQVRHPDPSRVCDSFQAVPLRSRGTVDVPSERIHAPLHDRRVMESSAYRARPVVVDSIRTPEATYWAFTFPFLR